MLSAPIGPPDAYLLADEQAACSRDRRFEYAEVSIGPRGAADGRLPIVRVQDLSALSDSYRATIGLADQSGSVMLVGGGLAQFRCAAWTRTPDQRERTALVQNLAKVAVAEAHQTGATPVAPYVAQPDLDAFSISGAQDPVRRGEWYVLDLHDSDTAEQWLARLHKKVRQTWNADRRASQRAGLSHDVLPLDAAGCSEAATAVANVSQGHGMTETPRMAEWRLRGYLARPGEHLMVRTLQDGDAVAYTVCRSSGPYLEAHTIGIAGHASERRTVYHFAGFGAVVDLAFAMGASTIGFGCDHGRPKAARGASGTATWRLEYPSA